MLLLNMACYEPFLLPFSDDKYIYTSMQMVRKCFIGMSCTLSQ